MCGVEGKDRVSRRVVAFRRARRSRRWEGSPVLQPERKEERENGRPVGMGMGNGHVRVRYVRL